MQNFIVSITLGAGIWCPKLKGAAAPAAAQTRKDLDVESKISEGRLRDFEIHGFQTKGAVKYAILGICIFDLMTPLGSLNNKKTD